MVHKIVTDLQKKP